MIYCSLDIETTGLDPKRHDIIEFGAILDDLSDPKPLSSLPRFHAYIIKDSYTGNPYAFSLHKEIFSRIAEAEKAMNGPQKFPLEEYSYKNQLYMKINRLFPTFYDFLVANGAEFPLTLAGKNVPGFDVAFLKEKDAWNDSLFRHRTIDPAILYFDPVKDDEIPGLQECLRRIDILEPAMHTSLGDAMSVIRLIRKKYSSTR